MSKKNDKDTEMDDVPKQDTWDFEDFDFEAGLDEPNSRKPVDSTTRQAIKFGKNLTTSMIKNVARQISYDMPNTTNLVEDGYNVGRQIKEIHQEIKTQTGIVVQDAKKAIRPFLPQAKKLLPKAIYDKIERSVKDVEESSGYVRSKEAERSDAIAGAIADIVNKQTKVTDSLAEENRAFRVFEHAKKEEHHKASLVSSQDIRHELQITNAFLSSSALAYMKKNLELQYRILFTAQDSLEVAKVQSALMNEQLPKISHNTMLPDTQKVLLSEVWKDMQKRRAVEFMSGKVREFIPKAFEKLKNKVTETGQNLSGGLNQLAFAGEMSQMMTDEQKKEAMSKGAANLIGMLMATPMANKIRPYLGTATMDAERLSSNYKEKAFRKAKKFRDDQARNPSLVGGLSSELIDSVLPMEEKNVYVEKDAAKDPYKPVHLDISMREAIVTVIPGYLSKILKQATDLATGTDNEEQYYDAQTGNFDSASEVFKRVRDRSFKNDEAVFKTDRSLGRMRGRFTTVSPTGTSKKTFDDQLENLRKVIFNINKHRLLFEVDKFLKFKDDQNLSGYIKKVYEGIDDPNGVNDVISLMVAPGGNIDDKAVQDFENWVMDADASEIHKKNLKAAMEQPGFIRLFDDKGVVDDRTAVRSKINKSWMEQGQLSNRSHGKSTKVNMMYSEGSYYGSLIDYEQARRAKQKRLDPNYDEANQDNSYFDQIDSQFGDLRDEMSIINQSQDDQSSSTPPPPDNSSNKKKQKRSSSSLLSSKSVKAILSKIDESIQTTSPLEGLVTRTNVLLEEGFKTLGDLCKNCCCKDTEGPSGNGPSGSGVISPEPTVTPSEAKIAGVMDEMKNMLSMHVSKSAEDRQALLETNRDMQMFNYHQGDPTQARAVISTAGRTWMKKTWSLGKLGLSGVFKPALVGGKVALGLSKLGFVVPAKMFSLVKSIATNKSMVSGAGGLLKGGFKAAWGLQMLPFKMMGKAFGFGKNLFKGKKGKKGESDSPLESLKTFYNENKDSMDSSTKAKYESDIAKLEQEDKDKKGKGKDTSTKKTIGSGFGKLAQLFGMNTTLNSGITSFLHGSLGAMKNGVNSFKDKMVDETGSITFEKTPKKTKKTKEQAEEAKNSLKQTKLLTSINKGIVDLVKDAKKDDNDRDLDGDGTIDKRKFGWGRLRKKDKKAKGVSGPSMKGKGLATAATGAATAAGGGGGGVLGYVGDKLSDVVVDKFGSKFSNLLGKTKYGSRLLQFLGIGGETAAVAGAGSGLGIMGTLGASVGTLSAGTIAGAVAVSGAIGVGTGLMINKITQHYSGSKDEGAKLLAVRKERYGIRVNGKVSAVKDFFAGGTRDWTTDLEKKILDQAEKDQTVKLSDSDRDDSISKLGWDIDDDSKAYFSVWFNGRFVPVFKSYLKLLKAFGIDYYSANTLDDVNVAKRIMDAVKKIAVPDERLVLDDFKLRKMVNKNKTWIDPVTGKTMQGEKPSDEILQAKQEEMEAKKTEGLTEEDEPWYKKGLFFAAKDKVTQKIAEKGLEDVQYDAKYKFSGDEAKLVEKTKAWIKGHEALRLHEYKDSRGYSTIGYGHLNKENYTKLTKDEADKLFDKDFDIHYAEAAKIPEFAKLDPVRRMALVDLVFNLGRAGFMNFKKTRGLLAEGNFPEAASNLLKSAYANQTGYRAREVAAVIKSGNEAEIKPKPVSVTKEDKATMDEKTLSELKQERFRDPNYMKQDLPASATPAATPAEAMKQQDTTTAKTAETAKQSDSSSSTVAPAAATTTTAVTTGTNASGMVAIKAAAPPDLSKSMPGAKVAEEAKAIAVNPASTAPVKTTGSKTPEAAKPEAPVAAAPIEVKVNTDSKAIVDETVITNQLLTKLIGIFSPIAASMSATARATAGQNAGQKPLPPEKTEPVVETRRRAS